MPVTKSSAKALRVSERRRVVRKPVRSRAKTEVTRVENLIAEGKIEEARLALQSAVSALDKATGKDVLPRNNAARRKSRLARKLNVASAAASLKAAETQPPKKEHKPRKTAKK